MQEVHTQPARFNAEEKEEALNWQEYLWLLWSKRYWFFASVLLSLAIAVFYLLRTTPVYTRTAQVLFKNTENSGSFSPKGNTAIQDLGLFHSNTNINNEIITLSAPFLMEHTVRKLHLDRVVSTKQGLQTVHLYNNSPLLVELDANVPEEAFFSFEIQPAGAGKVSLSHFLIPQEDLPEQTITAAYGQTVQTPVGHVTVRKSPCHDSEQYEGRTFKMCKYPVSGMAAAYSSRLSLALSDKESTIVNLSMTDEDPERAGDVLLALLDAYNTQWIEDKNAVAESTIAFISDRLDSITRELGSVDADIAAFKSANLTPDIGATSQMLLTQTAHTQNSLLQLNNQLSMAQYIRDYLVRNQADDQLIPAGTGIAGAGTEAQISEYNTLLLRRDELRANSSDKSPLVAQYNEQLPRLRTAILRSIENAIAQIQKQIDNVNDHSISTNRQIASNPQQERQILSSGRQQKVKESLYIYLLQKREETQLSKTYNASNTRIIQPPIGPNAPTSPRRNVILLIALAAGFALPAGILFLLRTFDNSVQGRADLEQISIPLVGEIPSLVRRRHWWQWKKTSNAPYAIHVAPNRHDVANETFRLARTKIDYFMHTKAGNPKVIMLTSFNPGSGKTMITSNLSVCFALKQKRVLVIDLDLRKQQLTKVSGQTIPAGLSSYLNGDTDDIHALIRRDALSAGVDVIPVGITPPNPTELLLSDRLRTLIETVRPDYDYILLDCAPIEIVADSNLIAPLADITLFIVRAGVMDKRLLPDVEQLYRNNEYNNMAILLNGTEYIHGKYGNYRYGYHYGYGGVF